MNRREFLGASTVAAMALAAPGRSDGAARGPKALLELRTYRFASPAKQKAFEEFLAAAMVPALNRAGIQPVGVFRMLAADNPKMLKEDSTDLLVLLPHATLESVITLNDRLLADAEYTKAGAAVINAPQKDPAYARMEVNLFIGFDECPGVETPAKAPSRLFQLRIYEAHTEERCRMKVRMFNEGGEIAIFRRVGMNPVFFGHAIAGTKMPNLTYMLGFDDEAAMKKGWAAFLADPAWTKLKNDETYKDTVSNITNIVLRPSAASQI